MCLRSDLKNRQTRVAASCLVIGLLLPYLFHPSEGPVLNLVHFVRGLLIGVSLALNLSLLWKSSRGQRSGTT